MASGENHIGQRLKKQGSSHICYELLGTAFHVAGDRDGASTAISLRRVGVENQVTVSVYAVA
jgi:hypothetical protein